MRGVTLGSSPAQLSTAERVYYARASLLNAYASTLVRSCVSAAVALAVAVSIRYLRGQRVFEWKWKQ